MKPAQGFAQIIIVAIVTLVIGAGAMFAYQKYSAKSPKSSDQKPVIATTSPSPSASTKLDETADWNAYTYKQMGLYLKYPKTWQKDIYNDLSLFTTRPTDKKPAGDFTPGTGYILIDAKALTEKEVIQNIPNADKPEDIIVDGVKSKKFTGVEGMSSHFITVVTHPKDNYVYKITFYTQDTDILDELTKEFNQILTTVKFVPIVN